MAGNKPGLKMFGLGALIGLIFSVALALLLSAANPVPPGGILASDTPPVTTAAAPASPEPVAPAPDDPKNEAATAAPAAESGVDASAAASPGPAPVEDAKIVDDAEAVRPSPADPPEEPRGVVETEAPEVVAATEPAAPVTAPEPEPQPAPAPAPAPAEVAAESPAPPPVVTAALATNAEAFDGDINEPVLAIVLESEGGTGNWADILALTFPMTVIVASEDPEAAQRIDELRGAGFEALLALSADEARSEEVGARLDAAEQVIGLAAVEDLGDAEAAAALMDALSARGMALLDLTADGGGASYRAAQSAGLPAAPTGRRFDAAPSSAAVYQALERAAFDARRVGAFVVVGAPGPSVMTGLRRWLNVKAGKSVALAPLSTVLEKMGR